MGERRVFDLLLANQQEAHFSAGLHGPQWTTISVGTPNL